MPCKPIWGAIDGGARVEGLKLVLDLEASLTSRGDGYGDIVDDQLYHLYHFLEASGRWHGGVDGLCKFSSGLEGIGGAVGNSDELHVLVGGELILCDYWLGEGIDEVLEGNECNIVGGTIPGVDQGPFALDPCGRSD